MVTYSGVTQTYKDTGGILGGASTRPGSGLDNARVKCILDQYTVLGTELSGSLLKLFGTIQTGANIIEILISVSAAQASATLSVGDSASTTRYVSASTGIQTAVPTITRLAGLNYVIGTNSGDNQIYGTTGGATLTAGTLYAALYYTLD